MDSLKLKLRRENPGEDARKDYGPSVPVELIGELLCNTEEAMAQMTVMLQAMTAQIADMASVQNEWFPKVLESLEETRKVIENNTGEGMQQARDVISAIEKLAEALSDGKG